jgi:hypothetical protein
MPLPDELQLAIEIIDRAKRLGIEINGPAEIEYGYGWIPTVTIWCGDCRLHLHYLFFEADAGGQRPDVLTLEVGYADANQSPWRTPIISLDEAWDIAEKVLIWGLKPLDMDREWVSDTRDVDKFIPHPPSQDNPANIVSLLSRPGWKPWSPPDKS